MKQVSVTLRHRQGDDPGLIKLGFFEVEDGWLKMFNEDGKPTTKVRLHGTKVRLHGEDPHRVATRLLREQTRKDKGFNRRIEYPRGGWR